jgi:flagellar basal body-associated protein FliL
MSIGGKENLKEEIIEELNNKLPGKIIRNVYFRTFVIQ